MNTGKTDKLAAVSPGPDGSALTDALAREAATRRVLEVINASHGDYAPVLDVILESATRLCDAPAAVVFFFDEEANRIKLMAQTGGDLRVVDAVEADDGPPEPSRDVIARCIVNKEIVHVHDLKDTDVYRSGDPARVASVDHGGIRTIIYVPMVLGGRCRGAIGAYRTEVRPFVEQNIALIETFAHQAVIAIENVSQFRAVEERNREIQTLNNELSRRVDAQVSEIERMGRLKRFLPAAVADAIVSSGDEAMLSSHRALIATLFCDIRGFTAFCEKVEPEDTIDVLRDYYTEMGKIIDQSDAGADWRIGDGIMVIFNDPVRCDNPAASAVRTAVTMRERMNEKCREWKRYGFSLGFGVGISLGYATVGIVGHEGRQEYSASGTSVNLASRLSEIAKDGEIILSSRARTAVEDFFEAEPAGPAQLKGFQDAVEIFRVVDKQPAG